LQKPNFALSLSDMHVPPGQSLAPGATLQTGRQRELPVPVTSTHTSPGKQSREIEQEEFVPPAWNGQSHTVRSVTVAER
jgi:hypothetical protein